MDKWDRLKAILSKEKSYYRLNKHAQEWLSFVQAEMAWMDEEEGIKSNVCLTRIIDRDTGRKRLCGLPRGHWKTRKVEGK